MKVKFILLDVSLKRGYMTELESRKRVHGYVHGGEERDDTVGLEW